MAAVPENIFHLGAQGSGRDGKVRLAETLLGAAYVGHPPSRTCARHRVGLSAPAEAQMGPVAVLPHSKELQLSRPVLAEGW